MQIHPDQMGLGKKDVMTDEQAVCIEQGHSLEHMKIHHLNKSDLCNTEMDIKK